MKKILSLTVAAAIMSSAAPVIQTAAAPGSATASVTYKYGKTVYTRQMEKLDRGLFAADTGDGIYVGWRLNGDECSVTDIKSAPSFEVYKNGEKIADVTDSTNYLDKTGTAKDSYSVAITGEDPCGAVSVNSQTYFDIAMDKPADCVIDSETQYSYTIGDCSTGDLDGDGQYEIVVKWDANPQDNSNSGKTGNVLLDAYKLDGTRLWRIDLGRNIRSGAHYTQFLVYDFDLDGKAEVTCKTAPGSLDGSGSYVSAASSDENIRNTDNTALFVNDGGYILEGDEFFTAFDGSTGAALDTIYYPVQRISASVWGDAYGNRCDRFLADVAYLDGENPYAVYWRGYYHGQSGFGQRTGICAMSLGADKKLKCNYCFDTYDTSKVSGYKGVNGYTSGNEQYVGQGNHNLSAADCDNDGKDEVFSGAMCMEVNENNKLMPRWCTMRGHGDALHIGDYDPTHDGLEFFTVHEEGNYTNEDLGLTLDYGMSVIDADTGEILMHEGADKDTGRGIMANVGAGGYYQIQSARNSAKAASGNGVFTNANINMSVNFRVFWDADLFDELLDGTSITSWNGSSMERIFSADGAKQINGTKANPALQADILGDWREEVCYPVSDDTSLRVFTTTDVTSYKLPTLMHDPVYRSGVAAEQTAYNQPPHIGFYLSDDMYRAALIGIDITEPDKTVYQVGEALDLGGLAVTGSYDDGSNYDIDGYSITGYDSMRAGEQTVAIGYRGFEKSFKVTVETGFVCDEKGAVTGYTGNAETAIIPSAIGDTEITSIAEGALDNISVKNLYVYENISKIENNSFAGIKVYCYNGSEMHIYALDNGVDFELIESGAHDYIVNLGFDEEEYSGFALYQSNQTLTDTKDRITYTVGGRNGGGDGTSGFGIGYNNEDPYLKCGVGQFATGGRNAYMNIADAPMISSGYDNIFSFDFMIPYTESKNTDTAVNSEAYANICDPAGTVDVLSIDNLGIEYDTWYSYSLIYHKNAYYRVLKNIDGKIISLTRLEALAADAGISKLEFLQCQKSIDANAFGKGSNSYIGIDNLQSYSADAGLSDIYVQVTDEYSRAVADAEVTIGETAAKTDADGIARFLLPSGIYNINVKADGYIETGAMAAAYRAELTKKVKLEEIQISAEAVSLPESASVKAGGTIALEAVTTPENATTRDFAWSSDNEAVASVDERGIVTGISEGSANIKVTLGNLEAVCRVTVADTSKYERIPAEIRISGGAASAYIPVTGVNSSVVFTAKVYDQKGIEMDNMDIAWSCDNVLIERGVLTVAADAEEGTALVTASFGDLSASVSVELIGLLSGSDIFAKLDYTDAAGLSLRQIDAESNEETIGDVTYCGGTRPGSTSTSIGVWSAKDKSGNIYLTGASTSLSNNGHGSYVVFNKAPSAYDENKDYVFETDIYFGSNTSVAFSNNITVSAASNKNLELKKWYHYMLVYSNGAYSEYIFDEDDNIISADALSDGSAEPLNKMSFGVNGEEGRVYLDNTYYYARKNAVSKLTVKVLDENAEPITGADISVGALSCKTNSLGRAVLELPIGVYNIIASTEDNAALTVQTVLDGTDKSISLTYDPSSLVKPYYPYYITAQKTGSGITAALNKYDGADVPADNTPVLYIAVYKGGHLVSVHSAQTGADVSSVSADAGGADEYKCFAWYKSGAMEPAASAYTDAG